jgi:hypothetical protein
MPPKEAVSDELYEAITAEFAELRGADRSVISQLLGTRTVKDWYRDWKEKQSLEAGLPDAWADAGLSAAAWAWATRQGQLRSDIRKGHAEATQELAKKHKQAVDRADAERDQRLRATDSPLLAVIEAGYDQLSLASQVRISKSADAASRKVALDAEILAFRRAALAELYTDIGREFQANVGPAGPRNA